MLDGCDIVVVWEVAKLSRVDGCDSNFRGQLINYIRCLSPVRGFIDEGFSKKRP